MRLVEARPFAFALAAIVTLAGGCGSSYTAICEDVVSCIGGNDDSDLEACEIRFEANEDIAAVVGCEDDFEAVTECLAEGGKCENESYSTEACASEIEDLNQCSDDTEFLEF